MRTMTDAEMIGNINAANKMENKKAVRVYNFDGSFIGRAIVEVFGNVLPKFISVAPALSHEERFFKITGPAEVYLECAGHPKNELVHRADMVFGGSDIEARTFKAFDRTGVHIGRIIVPPFDVAPRNVHTGSSQHGIRHFELQDVIKGVSFYQETENRASKSYLVELQLDNLYPELEQGPKKSADMVNHPPHYTKGKIEVWDFITDQNLSYCLGNVVKYVSRAGKKGDELEDLKKAQAYLNKQISIIEKSRAKG